MRPEMISPPPQKLQPEDFYDRKIDAHFAEIRLLREQRNANCSKTKNLPPETLVMIFGFLEYQFRGGTHPHLEWNAVTQVCRTWRNAALNEPTLWIDFTEPHPKWIHELFARSQAAPLILRFDPVAQDGLEFLIDHVDEHPERMKSLEICTKEPFSGLFNKPAPFLQALITGDDIEFPPDFLGGVAPRLEFLCSSGTLPLEASWLASVTKLDCRRLPLGARWFRQLTSLDLSWSWVALDARSGKIRRPSTEIILSALENMPLLQRLDIYFSYNMNETPCIRSKPVYLRHLNDITAYFSHPTTATIFNYLAVDSIEQLRTNWASSKSANVEPVLHFFNRCYQGGDLHYLSQTTRVEMGRFIGSNGEYVPVLALEEFQPADMASIVNQVPRCVPQLFETYLVHAFKMPSLKECDTIEQLRVYRIPELDDVLEFNDTSPPPYPSLRRIHFVGINFSPKRQVIPSLKHWLAGRDSKIILKMSSCNISSKATESLRKVAFVTSCRDIPGTIEL